MIDLSNAEALHVHRVASTPIPEEERITSTLYRLPDGALYLRVEYGEAYAAGMELKNLTADEAEAWLQRVRAPVSVDA